MSKKTQLQVYEILKIYFLPFKKSDRIPSKFEIKLKRLTLIIRFCRQYKNHLLYVTIKCSRLKCQLRELKFNVKVSLKDFLTHKQDNVVK